VVEPHGLTPGVGSTSATFGTRPVCPRPPGIRSSISGESKEWIAGFDILECQNLDEAIAIAARHPQANGGKLELRPFWTRHE
jgi:YCII-related domain